MVKIYLPWNPRFRLPESTKFLRPGVWESVHQPRLPDTRKGVFFGSFEGMELLITPSKSNIDPKSTMVWKIYLLSNMAIFDINLLSMYNFGGVAHHGNLRGTPQCHVFSRKKPALLGDY